MTTNELVNKLETKGYKVMSLSQMDRGKLVLRNDESVAYISNEDFRVNIKVPIPQEDAELIICYAYKLLEEHSANKHLVKIKGLTNCNSYLNINCETGEYCMASSAETLTYKTHFTKPEIDSLVANPNFFLQEGSYTLEDC